MTNEQKYGAVLKELGEVLQDKNTTISCQRWQIEELEKKLADASIAINILQEEIAQLKGE